MYKIYFSGTFIIFCVKSSIILVFTTYLQVKNKEMEISEDWKLLEEIDAESNINFLI